MWKHRKCLIVLYVLLLTACGTLTTPTGDRPLTAKEHVYQAGGVLLGIGQEIEFAIQTGALKPEKAKALVPLYEAAYRVYQRASALALAGNDSEATTQRIALLRLIDQLRRDLTVALAGGP